MAFLLDRGADIERILISPFGGELGYLVACSYCDIALRRLLLDRGADPNADRKTGRTPLQVARVMAANGTRLNWAEVVALLESAPPARLRFRTHWRHRILFHVVGRRTANPGSKRHELGLYRTSDIASFLIAPLPVSS